MRAPSRISLLSLLALQSCLAADCTGVHLEVVVEPTTVELEPGGATEISVTVTCPERLDLAVTYEPVRPASAATWFVPGDESQLTAECSETRGVTVFVPFGARADAPQTTFEVPLTVRVTEGGAYRGQSSPRSVTVQVKPPTPGQLTVRVEGTGAVTSTPAGIDCHGGDAGTCAHAFPSGQAIVLTPTTTETFQFDRWLGPADCADGQVAGGVALTCTARFVAATHGWRPLGASVNLAAPTMPISVLRPAVVAADGQPVTAWVEDGELHVARWNGTAWQLLGARVNVQPATSEPSLALDPTGAPVVAWQEDVAGEGRNVYVARFGNGAWTLLGGGPLDLAPALDAVTPVLLARRDDVVVAFSQAEAGGGSRIVVAAWSGTAWTPVGIGGGPPTVAMTENVSPKLALTGSTLSSLSLAVLWSQGATPRVAELLGTSWSVAADPFPTQVGPQVDITSSQADGLLVVAQPSYGTWVRVRRWDGAAWSDLGTPRGPAAPGGTIFGVAFSHQPGSSVLLAWSWRSGGIHQTVVERWAAGWAQVGAPIDAVDRRGAPAFEGPLSVADGTRPVVATQVSGSVPGSGAGDRSIVLHEFR